MPTILAALLGLFLAPPAPQYGFRVVNKTLHDRNALRKVWNIAKVFWKVWDGRAFRSRKVNLETGQVLQSLTSAAFFAKASWYCRNRFSS
jgi:hypothetical protein